MHPIASAVLDLKHGEESSGKVGWQILLYLSIVKRIMMNPEVAINALQRTRSKNVTKYMLRTLSSLMMIISTKYPMARTK